MSDMLHEFLTRERAPILALCQQEIVEFGETRLGSDLLENSCDIFYDELIGILQRNEPFESRPKKSVHVGAANLQVKEARADRQGKEYVRLGFTVAEVVHSFGAVFKAITELAATQDFTITSREFRQLTLSLDSAIAEAVTEFEKVKSEQRDRKETERFGFLAHELRNSLQSATIAMEMIEGGSFGARSNVGGVLKNSLQRMAELIDTSLTEVRMRVEPTVHPQRICLLEIINQVQVTAGFEARSRNLTLQVQGFSDQEVMVDRQLIVSALANLVQNALKFSKSGGMIYIRTRKDRDRILIEVEDQCGGLPEGVAEDMFKPFVQKSADRSGVGLGLTISRRAIELNNGKLRVENLPGEGCIFIIDLPQAPSPVAGQEV